VIVTTSLPAALDRGAGTGGFAVSIIFVAVGVGGVNATFFPFLGASFGV
jgi:proton-dependent oligopeptide transporter, POT family